MIPAILDKPQSKRIYSKIKIMYINCSNVLMNKHIKLMD